LPRKGETRRSTTLRVNTFTTAGEARFTTGAKESWISA
jgi:hypothetical protein